VANIVTTDDIQSVDMPSKPVNVKQVLVYLTPEQHAALQKLKADVGVPVSESIRRAIDRYLKYMESRR
jgi:predicted DNA-binding protein